MPDVYDELPRTAVNQAPGGGTDYPFVRRAGAGLDPSRLLDFYLSYPDAGCQFVPPFTYRSADSLITVRDADDRVVAEVDWSGGTVRQWGADRYVREWISGPLVVRCVVWQTPTDNDVDRLVLDPRTYNRLPARVTAFRVGLTRLTGNVRFQAGYNVDLSGERPADQVTGGRFRSAVNIDVVPGAGDGRLEGCQQVVPVVRRINQVGPDCAGNFRVEVDPCLRLGPPLLVTGPAGAERTAAFDADGLTADEAAHALRIENDCRPCCDCDAYVRTYRGLKRVRERWRELAAQAEAVRDTYEDNRARWQAAAACRLLNPSRLVVQPDRNCRTSIGGSYCNVTACCINALEIRFTTRKYRDGVPVVGFGNARATKAYREGSVTDGEEPYVPVDLANGRIIQFKYDFANPQDVSVAKMRYCVNPCAANESLEVAMTVHAPDPAPNPYTGETCELTDADDDVPEWVTELWDTIGLTTVGDTVRTVQTKLVPLDPRPPDLDCGC